MTQHVQPEQRKPLGRKIALMWAILAVVAVLCTVMCLAALLEIVGPQQLRALSDALRPILALLGGAYMTGAAGNVGEHFAARRAVQPSAQPGSVLVSAGHGGPVEEAPPPAPDPEDRGS